MPEHITIPISGFELSVNYVKPDVKLWVDRAPLFRASSTRYRNGARILMT
jgi:hypothetical protein